jgi:peptidoglycan/LPS O-acetylase OafA/YrhL
MYIPLGIFRFLLATFVFIFHSASVFDLFMAQINWSGLGVWMFFIVSGYVIFSAHETFYKGRSTRFLINRCIRIYPTLWVCLLFSLAVLYVSDRPSLNDEVSLLNYGLKEFLLSLSIIGGGLSNSAWAPLSPAFTLTIEMHFYFIAALLFLVLPLVPKHYYRAIFCYGLLFNLFYVFIELTNSQYRFFGHFRFSPFFILGASIFFGQKLGYRNLGVALTILLSTVLSLHIALSTNSSTGYIGFSLRPIGVTTSGLIFMMTILLAYLSTCKAHGKFRQIDRYIGDLTYPIYLIQLPLLALILEYFSVSGWHYSIVFYLICILSAALINFAVERPLILLRARWRGQNIETHGSA